MLVTKDKRIAEMEQQFVLALVMIQKLQKQVELLQTEVDELKRAGKRHRLRNCTTQTGSLFKLGWHLLI